MVSEHISSDYANAYYLNKYGINPRPDKTVNAYYRNKYGDEDDSVSGERPSISLLVSVSGVTANEEAVVTDSSEQEVSLWQSIDYFKNRIGDEYALVDELGFEPSWMGPLADNNHIF